ncbi:hypothetical protein MYXO_00131 [Myxococcaceae bacterium]|jgi:hypothetical protein|nr:hypothetical protein MYXO_00131 [Myxococcaceae bacterium]
MGKKGTSVLKRQRELKKAEKAAIKRDRRAEEPRSDGQRVASFDDLRGYGLVEDEEPTPRERH